jgi:hypothetical protein
MTNLKNPVQKRKLNLITYEDAENMMWGRNLIKAGLKKTNFITMTYINDFLIF